MIHLPIKQPQSLPPAVFLMGPTAIGKTALALTLCEHFPFDLISVDSAMVYRGMNIGTAKPDAETLARVPHQLIDICDPVEAYSAARFCQEALAAMQASTAQGRVPLLVGGTMLYFRALQQGLAPLPAADPAVRRELDQRAEAEGWSALHRTLTQLDPPAAQRIHPHDPQRIQRALEVCMTSGRTLTELQNAAAAWVLPFTVLKLALAPADRAVLHHRIAQRFDTMLKAGLLDEVAALRARGDLDLSKSSMRAVGYRQVWRFLAGELSAEAMREQGIIATRQLAKRQLTWLRSEQNSLWCTDENLNLTTITRLIDMHLP